MKKRIISLHLIGTVAENKIVIKYSEVEGLKAGDEILEINGVAESKILADAITKINGASENWKRLRYLGLIKTGDLNEAIKLKVKNSSDSIINFEIKRNLKISEFIAPRLKNFSEIAPGTIYINLNGLDENAFIGKYEMLAKAKKIIYDARGRKCAWTNILLVLIRQSFYKAL